MPKRVDAVRLERLLAGLAREVELAREADPHFNFDIDFDIPLAAFRSPRRSIALRLTLRHRLSPVISLVRHGDAATQ